MPAREQLMRLRYTVAHPTKPRRIAVLYERPAGGMILVLGTASQHRSRSGRLSRLRLRLLKRFGMSAFKR